MGNKASVKQEKRVENDEGMIEFLRNHGLEIVLAGSTVLLGAVCLSQHREILALAAENACLRKRVTDLVALCHEKDRYFLAVISDALRNGSSLGGKFMADRKAYLKVA